MAILTVQRPKHSRRRSQRRLGHLCHANLNLDGNMHEAVAAIAACGVSPLVRIAANEGWMVKRRQQVNCSFLLS